MRANATTLSASPLAAAGTGARLLAARAGAPAALGRPVALLAARGARDIAHKRRTHSAAAEARRAEAASHIVAARVRAAVGRLAAQASLLRRGAPDQRPRAISHAPPRQNNHCADSKCLRGDTAPRRPARRPGRGCAPAHSQTLPGRAPGRSARIGRCAHRTPSIPLRTLPLRVQQRPAAVQARLRVRRRGTQRVGRADALDVRLGERCTGSQACGRCPVACWWTVLPLYPCRGKHGPELKTLVQHCGGSEASSTTAGLETLLVTEQTGGNTRADVHPLRGQSPGLCSGAKRL